MDQFDMFKQKVSITQFLSDGESLEFKQDTYSYSYPEFIKYFAVVNSISFHHLIIGINFTYGWMPTTFKFRSFNFEKPLEILNKAKGDNKKLQCEDLQILKKTFNNSLVGTSKLLHFINPSVYAIWDSRVYRYLTGKEPSRDTIGNCDTYLKYLDFCQFLVDQHGFGALKTKIEKSVGYPLSPMRVVEYVMFLNGGKDLVNSVKK